MPGERRPRVVDFSTHFSGPVATQILTQLGADVVKIENPRTGDGNRGVEPLVAGEAMFHVALNAGKRSLAIDRRSPHWQRVVEAAARWADAVVVGARPADARARGLDFATLTKANPNLVYCAITGYGEQGPWRDFTAHGLNMDAFAGLVPIEWVDGVPVPRQEYRSVGTTLAGIYGALGILAALYRQRGGAKAQYVHVSIWGASMSWNWRDLTTYANNGHGWDAYKDLGSRYAMYPTADQRAILVCPIEQKFWEPFCELLGLPEAWKGRGSWAASGMDYGKDYEDEERAVIARQMMTKPLDEWVRILSEANIPVAPVLTWAEALESEHARVNGVMTRTTVHGQDASLTAVPVTIRENDDLPGEPPRLPSPPALGEHTDAILRMLGLDDLVGNLYS